MTTNDHMRNEDCTVDPGTYCCSICDVSHGDPCAECGGRGFHRDSCGELCEATDADECRMIRERLVAGESDAIPSCPIHPE